MNAPVELLAPERRAEVAPRIHAAGASAILFDPSDGPNARFDAVLQQRLIALARRIREVFGNDASHELVPGVNNLLFVFDPLRTHPREARDLLLRLWETVEPSRQRAREIEIPVVYGGPAGEDLIELAKGASLDVTEYIRRHASTVYTVACIGSMPGFAYMTGLPPELHVPRRKVPRMKVAAGTVIVGGAQAGVMPCTAPSGWHLIGETDVEMFKLGRPEACLLAPGDRVQFSVKRIEL
ncbi:KipI family sensor histidine kinase inhibitor [Paraburkholderia unamae]|uniref:5-oxoprolinase subunit PxpB n=1 Tax=Paraburkholderia unamae TaxID=219649 RepID=UPI000DC452CD|nr:5-oxoprolinase subunit PxpB [Paraburkholderia unamae]RAR54281.1 KipI family sensor histidine kinase inhibitor [Paraburkholderia unamae]